VASLSQGRTAAAQCGLFTYKSVPVIFEPPCVCVYIYINHITTRQQPGLFERKRQSLLLRYRLCIKVVAVRLNICFKEAQLFFRNTSVVLLDLEP